MVELFTNLLAWISAHQTEIITTVTSATFINSIVSICNLIKDIKAKKENTELTKNLVSSAESLNGAAQSVKENGENIAKLESNYEQLYSDFKDYKLVTDNKLDLIISKVDAMLDVQANVYSTIKDESLKETVFGIITSAKYKESNDVIEMRNKIEELQKALQEKAQEMNSKITESVKAVKKVVKTVKDNTVTRA